jgi:hypothetical protein
LVEETGWPIARHRRRQPRKAVGRDHRRVGAPFGAFEIDAAARIAEIGVAGGAEDAPALLVERMGEAPDLGGEGGAVALHLAD